MCRGAFGHRDQVDEVLAPAIEDVVYLQAIDAVGLGDKLHNGIGAEPVFVVRKRNGLALVVLQRQRGVEKPRHRVADIRLQFARRRREGIATALLELEREGVGRARQYLPVKQHFPAWRDSDLRQFRRGTVRRRVKRLGNMRRGGNRERTRGGDSVRAVETQFAAPYRGGRIGRDRDQQLLAQRRRRLQRVLWNEKVALHDCKLTGIERCERAPPRIRAPFVDMGVFWNLRLLELPGGDAVEPVLEMLALGACRRGEAGHVLDLEDMQPTAAEPQALYAVQVLPAYQDAVGRPGLHAGGVYVADIGVGREKRKRQERESRKQERACLHFIPSPHRFHAAAPPRTRAAARSSSSPWNWVSARRDRLRTARRCCQGSPAAPPDA